MSHKRLIVQKYGGSSLSSPQRIHHVADRIAARADADTGVIVTVSAMGETTDELLRLARAVTPNPPQREMDMLLSVGERITMSLLSMALCDRGCPAISFTGSQSGIVTTVSHSRALIEEIRGERIEEALAEDKVVIVAGFQGVSRKKEITTLGRGGSDTTAVALAARLDAERCEIYSNFAGVFTADPRVVPQARRIPHLTHDAMLELAALGARVLHFRAADIARRFNVTLDLLSSFEDGDGTRVDAATDMERPSATSVTCNRKVVTARVTHDSADAACELLTQLQSHEAQVISYTRDGATIDAVFDARDAEAIEATLQSLRTSGATIETRDDLATVSVVGTGFAGAAEALASVEEACRAGRITVEKVYSSALSITCLVPVADCDKAVKALHTAMVD